MVLETVIYVLTFLTSVSIPSWRTAADKACPWKHSTDALCHTGVGLTWLTGNINLTRRACHIQGHITKCNVN